MDPESRVPGTATIRGKSRVPCGLWKVYKEGKVDHWERGAPEILWESGTSFLLLRNRRMREYKADLWGLGFAQFISGRKPIFLLLVEMKQIWRVVRVRVTLLLVHLWYVIANCLGLTSPTVDGEKSTTPNLTSLYVATARIAYARALRSVLFGLLVLGKGYGAIGHCLI